MAESRGLGSVVVAAHNEEAVILRTLQLVAPLIDEGLDVVVVANGCSDGTADLARSVPGIRVVELLEASKTAALNAGDRRAGRWPRLYLDADVDIEPAAVRAVFARLERGDVLAARPASRYQTDEASRLVRSYYRARSRIPAMSEHLWGAGAYALTERGHARLGCFPPVVADDLYVDGLFGRSEIAVVDCQPVLVRTPRTARALSHVLRRVYRGKAQVSRDIEGAAVGSLTGLRRVLAVVRSRSELADAVVYCTFAVLARLLSLRASTGWLRDETSRVAPAPATAGGSGAVDATMSAASAGSDPAGR